MSRCQHYMARVATHLPSLPSNAARHAFLTAELAKWEERYRRFQVTEGESHRTGDAPGQPTAFDFAETIAALGAEQQRYAQKEAA